MKQVIILIAMIAVGIVLFNAIYGLESTAGHVIGEASDPVQDVFGGSLWNANIDPINIDPIF